MFGNLLSSAGFVSKNSAGYGVRQVGRGFSYVGNTLQGAGAKLQASAWNRKLTMAGVTVCRVNAMTGKAIVMTVGGQIFPVMGETALTQHFIDYRNRLLFQAEDANNANAVNTAAKWQAEFDARTLAAHGWTAYPDAQPAQPQQPAAQPQVQQQQQPKSQPKAQQQLDLEVNNDEIVGNPAELLNTMGNCSPLYD